MNSIDNKKSIKLSQINRLSFFSTFYKNKVVYIYIGDLMKKAFMIYILFTVIGFFIGTKIFYKTPIPQQEKYIFLQEGIYDNNDIFESNLSDLHHKVMEYKNNKIYVYVGITRDLEVAETISRIYEQKNISLKSEEKVLESEELKYNIEQFDLLVKKATSEEEIIKIEEVVLANYEEIIKNKE